MEFRTIMPLVRALPMGQTLNHGKNKFCLRIETPLPFAIVLIMGVYIYIYASHKFWFVSILVKRSSYKLTQGKIHTHNNTSLGTHICT
jgi:hypothetical protein